MGEGSRSPGSYAGTAPPAAAAVTGNETYGNRSRRIVSFCLFGYQQRSTNHQLFIRSVLAPLIAGETVASFADASASGRRIRNVVPAGEVCLTKILPP